ncbi:hypothetical protein [Chelativorans sp. ZYF759]|nr:hypothetical protein [Chelativorans sp. ZYF759]
MSQRNFEFEIALLVFVGFFVAALWALGGGSFAHAIAGPALLP